MALWYPDKDPLPSSTPVKKTSGLWYPDQEEEQETPTLQAPPPVEQATGLQATAPPPPQKRASLFKQDAPYAARLLGMEDIDSGFDEGVQSEAEKKLADQSMGQRWYDLVAEGSKGTVKSQEMGFGVLSKFIGSVLPEGAAEETLEIPGIPEAEAVMGWGTPEVTEGFFEGARREGLEPDKDFVQPRNWGEGFIMAIPQIVGQAASTALGGHAVGTLAMFGQIAGNSYDTLVSQGVDEDRAMAAGIVNGLIQAPLEQLGMGTITSVFKPRMMFLKRLKNLVKHMGTEGATEFLQKYPEEITSLIAKNPGAEWVEHAKAIQDNLLEWTKEGLAWDLPIGMAMGAFFGAPGMISKRGGFDPDSVPKAPKTAKQAVKDWFKDNYGVEALFTPGIVAGAKDKTPSKKTTAEGATEVEQAPPAGLKTSDRKAGEKTPAPLKFTPAGVTVESKQAVEITAAAQRSIEKKNVDAVFMEALNETIDELAPAKSAEQLRKEGPKTTQPTRLVTPAMVEEAEQKARARRVEKAIKEDGENYKGEALVDSKTGLPFKDEAAAKVAITRMKQENPKYKNWEWEVVPANVNVNEGFGVKPIRPMKRTSAIVRNALRTEPEAKIGDIYKETQTKAKEEKATRQEVAKIVRDERSEQVPKKLEVPKQEKATKQEKGKGDLTTEKLTTPKEDVPKPKSEKLEAKPKSKSKAIKLGIGVEVSTEEGKGIITGKGGKGQWTVEITEGPEKGEGYPFNENELEAIKEVAQDVKTKKTTSATLEALSPQVIKDEAAPDYRFDAVTVRRKVTQGGYAALPLQSINDGRLMLTIDTQKWPTPHESSEFGTVNNRLSKELEVIEALIGPIATAKMMPGKLVKGKRPLTRTIGAYELGLEIDKAVKDGTFKKLLDPKNKPKDLADERDAKYKEMGFRQVRIKQLRQKFLKELKEFRTGPVFLELDEDGKPILSINGKAGMSVDLLIATCQPTTPCKECYAAKAMIRMSNVRKSVRNTIHLMVDPIGFAERIAKEARSVKKTTLPFIRLLGSGDLTHASTVKSFNHLAQIADRPIHIFSRHHRNLAKLKGTKTAPFIKMGSIDADLVEYYGMKFMKENMEKRGIANVFLLTDKSEIATLRKLYKAGALNLVFAANKDLHNAMEGDLKQSSCPCDAQERTYMASCRRCALGQLGCHMAFADKGLDINGKVWELMDDKAPTDLTPITVFVEGDEIVEAYGKVAADIHQKSIELINLYKAAFNRGLKVEALLKSKPKGYEAQVAKLEDSGTRKDIPLKDIRFPDDIIRVDSVEKADQYIANLKAAKKAALAGTFDLPGGDIQPGVSAKERVLRFEERKRPRGLEKTKKSAAVIHGGAVGTKAVVPKVVISLAGLERGDNWLDFGGGGRAHADHIEIETGSKVDVYDFNIVGSEKHLKGKNYRGMSMSNVLNTQQVDADPDSLELLEYTTQQMHDFFELNPNAQIIANYPSSPHYTPSPYRAGERMNKVEMENYLEEHFEVRKVKLKVLQLSGVKSAADVFVLRVKEKATPKKVKALIRQQDQRELFSTDHKYTRAGEVTTLGVGITTDLINKEVVDFDGMKVESAEDIAVIAQVVRDPKVETFRTIYVKDGVVVHHQAVSSRLPHTTAAFVGDDSRTGLTMMKKIIRDTGADSVYLLHNHPIGFPDPSTADLRGTQALAQQIPEIKSHIIIDSGTYAEIKVDRKTRQTVETPVHNNIEVPGLPANWKDPLLTPSMPHEALGKRALSTEEVVHIGQSVKVKKDYGVLLMLNTDARVKSVQEIPLSLLKPDNLNLLRETLSGEQDLVGAYEAVIYVPGKDYDSVASQISELILEGYLADVVVSEGSLVGGTRKIAGMFFGRMERDYQGVSVRTDTAREQASGDDAVDVTLDEIFGSEQTGLRDNLKSWWRDFSLKTWMFDGLNPILDAFGATDESSRIYKLFRMLKGTHASVEAMMKHGKLVLDENGVLTVNTKKKGYAELVKKHGTNLRDALRWAAAKRSLELHQASANVKADIAKLKAEGKADAARKLKKKSKHILDFTKMEELLTKEEAANVLEQYGERPDGSDLSYQELFDLHDEFHQSVLDIAVNSGVISKEMREQWRDFTYVPFYRVFEDAETKAEFFKNPKAGVHIASKANQKVKGSKRKINEPMENAIANWAYLIQESMRNRATAEAYFTAQHMKYELGSTLMEDIAVEDIEGIVINNGIITYKTKGGDPNVMSFLVNGERKYFQVTDTALFNALSSINKQGLGKLFNMFFGTPKRILTYTATFGPAFRVANLLRDTLHTWMITPGADFKPFLDSFKGFVRAWRNDQDVIKNMAAGGLHGGSYINAEDPKALGKFTKDLIAEQNRKWGGSIINNFKKALEWWMRVGEASENAARVMRHEQIIKKGGSTLDAAFGSRDLLDFAMRGEGKAWNVLISMVPFLNARNQGNYRMYRGMKENPVDFAIKGAILAAASLALWAAYKDDDRYKELPDYEKFLYYHAWIGDQHVRMPKPFETGIIFSSFVESVGNVATGNEEAEFMWKFFTHAALETLAFNPVPQTLKPIAEVWGNKSFFTGRPIETMSDRNLKPGDRASHYTSETLQLIGKGLNISPKKMEALSRGYLSTMSSFLLAGPDQISRWFGHFPEKPTLKTNEFPLIGRFWRQGPARSTKYMTRFYDILTESNELVGSVKHYSKLGDYAKVRKLRKDNRKLWASNKRLKKYQQRLAKYRKKIKKVYISKLSAEEKSKRIDMYTRKLNSTSKKAYEYYMNR